jgi:hypothetical protein
MHQLSILGQWKDEVVRFTEPGTCKAVVHYQDRRLHSVAEIAGCDFVITSYGTVSSEARTLFSAAGAGPGGSSKPSATLLFGVVWNRIVLDEAHLIKNKATDAAKACSALLSIHRWCITGTPIQNSLQVRIACVRACVRGLVCALCDVVHAPRLCACLPRHNAGSVLALSLPAQRAMEPAAVVAPRHRRPV